MGLWHNKAEELELFIGSVAEEEQREVAEILATVFNTISDPPNDSVD